MLADNHIHLFNERLNHSQIFVDRKDIDLNKIIPYLNELADHETLESIGESIYNLFADKNIHLQELLKNYVNDLHWAIKHTVDQLSKAGITHANLLNIKFGARRYAEVGPNYLVKKAKEKGIEINYFLGLMPKNDDDIILKEFDFMNQFAPTIKGIKIYPAMNSNIDGIETIFRIADNHKIPIIFHASSGGIGANGALNKPWLYYDMIEKYPNVNVCFAHFGGTKQLYRSEIKHMMLEFENVYADTAFLDDAYFSTNMFFLVLKEELSNGARLIYGSDYPLSSVYYTYRDMIELYKRNLGDYHQKLIFEDYYKDFMKVED